MIQSCISKSCPFNDYNESFLAPHLTVSTYTYNAHIIRLLHAGRTKHPLHKKHQGKQAILILKPPVLLLFKGIPVHDE